MCDECENCCFCRDFSKEERHALRILATAMVEELVKERASAGSSGRKFLREFGTDERVFLEQLVRKMVENRGDT